MTYSIVAKGLIAVKNTKNFWNGARFIKRHMADNKIGGIPYKNVINKLEEFAPLSLSEKWDNTGVLIEPFTPRIISNILLTNDLTEDVMDEAVTDGADMIVSYHPPIFSSLKRVTQDSWKQRIVSRCLEERIAVYSPHTSWDSVSGGVNDWLADSLPDHKRDFIIIGLLPDTGSGRLCELTNPTKLEDIIVSVKNHTGLKHVQLALARDSSVSSIIKSVAICAGSGASLLRGVKADLYLTGEMGHHEVLDAVHCGTSVILTNHSNSERGFLQDFSKKLEKILENKVKVKVSLKDEDPLKTV